MKASDLLLQTANQALSLQRPDGSFPAGHNGPYHDPETAVRNSGHWLITLAKCHGFTGESRYKDAIHKIARYLISPASRPHGYSFSHRTGAQKDHCNGLIGPAWTFEALEAASSILEDDSYRAVAEDVFLRHVFVEDKGVWRRLEINGRNLGVDGTFNHQLWFAACAALVKSKRQREIRDKILSFMDSIPRNLTVLDEGLIHHEIEWVSRQSMQRPKKRLARFIKGTVRALSGGRLPTYPTVNQLMLARREHERQRSIGYHAFNMHAFAMLKERIPEHPVWKSPALKSATSYLRSFEYEDALADNKYGYPYNPPGFEVPYALSVLEGDWNDSDPHATAETWINRQVARCFNFGTRLMDRGTEDPVTHAARIYELSRLPDRLLAAVNIHTDPEPPVRSRY